jgi:curved DNA-binding protein CbpA
MSDRLDQLDYYDLLQVDESASADDVRRAFHVFAAKFHPDRFAGAPDEKTQRALTIYRRGAEAYRVLSDWELRQRYDWQRARGKLRFDPEDTSSAPSNPPPNASSSAASGPIQVRSHKARPFAQKAWDAYKKMDWPTARLNFKLAIQHEPGNALLEARLADVEQKIREK